MGVLYIKFIYLVEKYQVKNNQLYKVYFKFINENRQ